MRNNIFLKFAFVSCAIFLVPEWASAIDVVANGVDNTRNVVFSINTDYGQSLDSEGPGYFAILIDKRYDYNGTHYSYPPGGAEFALTDDRVLLNENTSVDGTLGVSGATTINNSLITNNGANAGNLRVNSTANQASLTVRASAAGSTDSGVFVSGVDTGGATPNVIIKGGTRSGILKLQDGDAPANGATPAGTSITISGSGGGTAATVFQTTTDPNTTTVSTFVGTNANYSGGSTATLQAGQTNAVTVNSGNAGALPGVSINGVVGTGSTSTTGVLITGSGQNTEPYTPADRANGVIPTWADVAIKSKSYGLADPTLGSAILVTDYGVQILSPQPASGQQITNNTGNNSGAGNVTNGFGQNTSVVGGTVNNNIGGTSGNGNVFNTIGYNSGTGIASNGFGTGTGVTNNYIGNSNPSSTVQLDGGPSRMVMDGNGATFSNSSTGGPIQVHGVADGTSPNDAANISQVFGGVAASMATTPSVTDLKPGQAGFGIGFGHYAGYTALGLNLTYYARNQAQMNLGVAHGLQGGAKAAIRGSIGFKF